MFRLGGKADELSAETEGLVAKAKFAKKLAAFMAPLTSAGNEISNAIDNFEDKDLTKGMLRRAGENLDASTKILNDAIRILDGGR